MVRVSSSFRLAIFVYIDIQGFYTKRKTWFAADVCHMLEEYVRVSGIRPYIRLQQELVDQSWDKTQGEDGMWTLKARVCLVLPSCRVIDCGWIYLLGYGHH